MYGGDKAETQGYGLVAVPSSHHQWPQPPHPSAEAVLRLFPSSCPFWYPMATEVLSLLLRDEGVRGPEVALALDQGTVGVQAALPEEATRLLREDLSQPL